MSLLLRRARTHGTTLFAALVLVVLAFGAWQPRVEGIFLQFFILLGVAIAWNIVGGFAGQLSLGMAAPFGIGAYTAATLSYHDAMPVLLRVTMGGVAAGVLCVVLVVSLRTSGAYFAIITLAFAAILTQLASEYAPGQAAGLSYIVFPAGSSTPLRLAGGAAVLALLFSGLLRISPAGRAMEATRMDPDAARAIGINVLLARASALVCSSVVAGVAGSIYALNLGFIDPDTAFSLTWCVIPVLAVILGGSGHVLAPVVGAALWTAINQFISNTQLGSNGFSVAVEGAILLVVTLLLPMGLLGTLTQFTERMGASRRAGRDVVDAPDGLVSSR